MLVAQGFEHGVLGEEVEILKQPSAARQAVSCQERVYRQIEDLVEKFVGCKRLYVTQEAEIVLLVFQDVQS